jgi:hypothetical protein
MMVTSRESRSTAVVVGSRFDLLTVTAFSHRDSRSRAWWHCHCDCGQSCTTRQDSLLRPLRRHSCGCLRRQNGITHNGSHSPTYQTWLAMRRRCRDPKYVSYRFYGARGITVCAEWNDSRTGFTAFLRDMGERPPGMTLDRKRVEGNYEPGNCQWATRQWQDFNRRGAVDAIEDAREYAHGEEEEAAYLAAQMLLSSAECTAPR